MRACVRREDERGTRFRAARGREKKETSGYPAIPWCKVVKQGANADGKAASGETYVTVNYASVTGRREKSRYHKTSLPMVVQR